MRIGLTGEVGGSKQLSVDWMIDFAKEAENKGFSHIWLSNIFGFDAITVLSLMGRETEKIGLGTAVVPSYPRHPTALAQQVMTASAATNGRFELGIGLSHKLVIEDMFGLCYDKPARHMREYLSVLKPLIEGENVNFTGEEFNVHCQLKVPSTQPVPLIVAALGPVMLKIAGQMADGTITWMTGTKTLASHIVPSITNAAAEVGKPDPRVVAGLPMVLTADIEGAREKVNQAINFYGNLPSYRAMLDKEGVASPGDVALLGDETALRQQLQQLRDAGVTDFNAVLMDVEAGSYERTLEFLSAEIST